MMLGKTFVLIGLFGAALAAGQVRAACDVRGTITNVEGDAANASLTREGRTLRVQQGLRICGGDMLTAGAGTVIRYVTVNGRPEKVAGSSLRFSEREGYGMSALSSDPDAGDDPH
jgi:hypothetical protein